MKLIKRYGYLLLFLFTGAQVFAQQKTKLDIVVKTNGEELKGEVKEDAEHDIKFVYTGETLLYTINKKDIQKIIFSSGRVETINEAAVETTNAATNNTAAAPVDHQNKIAILPFGIVMDGQSSGEEMALQVQNECFNLLNNHTGNYTIIDNHTTNALLVKGGVNAQNISGFTMQELCDIIGAAYVVSGMISINKTMETQYNSSSQNSTTKKSDNSNKKTNSSYGSSYSTNTQNYATNVQLQIFNDRNESVYNQNRRAFWPQVDAYKSTMEYLIKRAPLYKK